MNALASRIAERLLDSDTRIGPLIPCQWADDVKEAVPGILEHLAGQATYIDNFTDRQIGEAFRVSIRNETGVVVMTAGHDVTGAMGAWLRAAVKADDGSETVPETTPDYPEYLHFLDIGHGDEETALRGWADNGVDDVKVGVDEQMAYFADVRVPSDATTWYVPRDGCQSSGRAKDHVGAVMRYKKARLAAQTLGEPVLTVPEYLTERPAIGTRFLVTARSKGTAYLLNVGEEAEVTAYSNHNEDVVWGHVGDAPDWTDGDSGRWVTWTNIRTTDLTSVPEADEPPVEVVEEPTVTRSAYEALQTRLGEAVAARRQARMNHEADIALIGERLIQEATDRRWCSEYDQIIDDLNGQLTVELPPRAMEVEVSVSGYVRVPFSVTTTVTRTGDMDDNDVENQAFENVNENWGAYTLATDYGDPYGSEVEDDMEVSID